MQRLVMLAALFSFTGTLAFGCGGPVTEEDLQKWSHNERGFARLTEVVTDPKQPLDTRVRALEVVVEKGQPMRIRNMVDDIPDDRGPVVDKLVARLISHVEKQDSYQYDAKDAVLLLQRYMEKAAFAPIQKVVAAWAFRGLTWDSTSDEVKKAIEERISSGQIADLGPHGYEGAGILIGHGFVVDKMLDYLTDAKDPDASAALLKGVERLHKSVGAQIHHVEYIRRTGTPEAARYLLTMYADQNHDPDIRLAAFNEAIAMLDNENIKRAPGPVVDYLLKMMEGTNPEDRWLGAINVVRLVGDKKLEQVLDRFKDDKVYRKAEESPQKSVMDFCLDIRDRGYGKRALPVFIKNLRSENRIVKAISIVCLKANDGRDARLLLKELASKAPSGDQPPEASGDVSIDDFLGDGLTIGKLAANAVEGLKMLEALADERDAAKLDPIQYQNRSLIVIFELTLTGDEYTRVVRERTAAFEAEYKANPDAFKPKDEKAGKEDEAKAPAAKAEGAEAPAGEPEKAAPATP